MLGSKEPVPAGVKELEEQGGAAAYAADLLAGRVVRS